MARSAESILEDILNQLEKSGSGVQQQTASDIKASMKQTKASKRESQRQSAEAASGALKDLSASSTQLNSVTPKLFKGFGGLMTRLGPVGHAIGLVTIAATKFYEFMDENLSMYKQFNTEGFRAADGMMGLYGAVAESRLTMDEFNSAINESRDVFASMGASGARDVGKFMSALVETEASAGMLNMTNEQAAKYLMNNLKIQKAYGAFERMDANARNASNREYMDNLNKYSKSLGISTTELSRKLSESSDTVNGFGTQLALTERGMDPDIAQKTSENLNMVLGSFGEFGGQFGDQFSRFLEYGEIDLDSSIGKLFQTSDETREIFNNMREMALSGELSTEAGAEQIRQMLSSGGFVDSIDGSMAQIRSSFGDVAANQIIKWRNQLNNYNTDNAKVEQTWDTFVNSFNRTIEGMMSAFKGGVSTLFLEPKKFFTNFFGGGKWAKWFVDGVWDFGSSLPDLAVESFDFLKQVTPAWVYDWLTKPGYLDGVSSRLDSGPPSFEKLIKALLPDWLSAIILDGNGDFGLSDSAKSSIDLMNQQLNDGIDDISNGLTSAFDSATDKANSIVDGTVGAISGGFDDMISSVSDFFNTGAQTTIQKTTEVQRFTRENTMVAMPEYGPVHNPQEMMKMLADQPNKLAEYLEKLVEYTERQNNLVEEQIKEVRRGNRTSTQVN